MATRRRLVVLALLAGVVAGMIRLHLSPWQFVSISTLATSIVLVLQTFIQNLVAGVSVELQSRYPIGSRLAVENAIGIVTAHHLLNLELKGDDGSSPDVPYSKLLQDIVIRNPPTPQEGN